jgi:hypothetical protein
MYIRASPPGAHYVTLDSEMKCLSFNCFFTWANPANKTETGTVHTWGTINSKPPGPIILIQQLEILYYTLFLEVHNCVAHFLATCVNLVLKNQFPELNWHILTSSK